MISITQAAHQRAHDALGQEYWLYALQFGFLEQHLVAAVIRDFFRLDAGAVEDFFVVDGAHLCAEVEDKRRRRRQTISFQVNINAGCHALETGHEAARFFFLVEKPGARSLHI
jgi:hypothetical protein